MCLRNRRFGCTLSPIAPIKTSLLLRPPYRRIDTGSFWTKNRAQSAVLSLHITADCAWRMYGRTLLRFRQLYIGGFIYTSSLLTCRNFTATHVGKVLHCPSLSNIKFNNHFTIRPLNINFIRHQLVLQISKTKELNFIKKNCIDQIIK